MVLVEVVAFAKLFLVTRIPSFRVYASRIFCRLQGNGGISNFYMAALASERSYVTEPMPSRPAVPMSPNLTSPFSKTKTPKPLSLKSTKPLLQTRTTTKTPKPFNTSKLRVKPLKILLQPLKLKPFKPRKAQNPLRGGELEEPGQAVGSGRLPVRHAAAWLCSSGGGSHVEDLGCFGFLTATR